MQCSFKMSHAISATLTAALLIFNVCVLASAQVERRAYTHDNNELMSKYLVKFKEAQVAGDGALELTLADGFVTRMREMNESILREETDYYTMELLVTILTFVMLGYTIIIYRRRLSEISQTFKAGAD